MKYKLIHVYMTKETCPRCKKILLSSNTNDYKYQCFNCDEDFYGIEINKCKENK